MYVDLPSDPFIFSALGLPTVRLVLSICVYPFSSSQSPSSLPFKPKFPLTHPHSLRRHLNNDPLTPRGVPLRATAKKEGADKGACAWGSRDIGEFFLVLGLLFPSPKFLLRGFSSSDSKPFSHSDPSPNSLTPRPLYRCPKNVPPAATSKPIPRRCRCVTVLPLANPQY